MNSLRSKINVSGALLRLKMTRHLETIKSLNFGNCCLVFEVSDEASQSIELVESFIIQDIDSREILNDAKN